MINKSNGYRIAGIGELLWDLLPDGKQLGGSPMNVVYHCQNAGIKSVVISSIGDDIIGHEIIDIIEDKENSIDFIQICSDWPTGTVSVELKGGIPDFTIHKNVAWDNIKWNKSLEVLAKEIDAVAFGSLAQRSETSRNTIRNFIRSMKPDAIKVFDINLRQNYHSRDLLTDSLELATILKINDEELPVLADYLELSGSNYDQIKKIIDLFNLEMIAYTKGSRGSVIYTKDFTSVRKAPEVEIKDTIGAGDTFTAILIVGLLNNKAIEEIHKEASEAAAWVCSQKGGTPKYSTD